MWDAEKTCTMRYNLQNGKMRKSHLTAYKLASLFVIAIATIYIHNTSSAVSALGLLGESDVFATYKLQKTMGKSTLSDRHFIHVFLSLTAHMSNNKCITDHFGETKQL